MKHSINEDEHGEYNIVMEDKIIHTKSLREAIIKTDNDFFFNPYVKV